MDLSFNPNTAISVEWDVDLKNLENIFVSQKWFNFIKLKLMKHEAWGKERDTFMTTSMTSGIIKSSKANASPVDHEKLGAFMMSNGFIIKPTAGYSVLRHPKGLVNFCAVDAYNVPDEIYCP
ncbi:hypothetical protein CBER1_10548 [Cercospora berteroae]|uniref:Uncharacterized protein n=1 Tax=Cercospora berteroae TaxID=357750 RepID=A0A2S6CIZ1_9PEZI|nr:hypothetical protein CBER1_10548 [Cercospora berteroae]